MAFFKNEIRKNCKNVREAVRIFLPYFKFTSFVIRIVFSDYMSI